MALEIIDIYRDDIGIIGEIVQIENDSFSDPWSRKAFEDTVSSDCAHLFALVENEENYKVLGYLCLMCVAEDSEILNIAVEKSMRRNGYGNILMEKAIETAENSKCTGIFLEVRQSNEPAIGLYRKYGFEPIGVRKGYYTKPKENAIVMKRDID